MSQEIWVKEMPKCCAECEYRGLGGKVCSLLYDPYFYKDYDRERRSNCPLHDIHDYKRELVKKVCEKISNTTGNKCLYIWTPDKEDNYTLYVNDKILDQIAKEFEDGE